MADLYFDWTLGDDATGDGSIGNPWKTPNKAAAEVAAGDTCHFADGTYVLTSTVTLVTTGTAANHITMMATNSGQVTWDMNNAIGAWVLTATSMDYYDFDGIVFEGNETSGVSQLTKFISCDHYTWTECEWTNTQGHCLTAQTCDDWTLTDCEIHSEVPYNPPAGLGLSMEGIWGLYSTNFTLTGCEIYRVSHQAILLQGGSDWLIDDCYIHDTSSHCVSIGDSSEADSTTNITIQNSRIENAGEFRYTDDGKHGVFIRHLCENITVRWNRIWDCDGPGVTITRAATGPIYVYHNSFAGNSKAALPGANWGEVLLSDTGTNRAPAIFVKNNIFQHETANRTYAFDSNARTNLDIDYNLLYDVTGTENILADASYGTYAAYKAGGWEPNSIISQDPLFTNRGAEDFSLQPGSPAIGAAVNLGLGSNIGWWQTLAASLAGTLTTAGTVLAQAEKVVAGSVTSSGTLTKATRKILDGAITFVGLLSSILEAVTNSFVFLTGLLIPAGSVVKETITTRQGTLTTAGALVSRAAKVLAGTLTSSGTLIKLTSKILAGVLSTAGALVGQGLKFLEGNIGGTSPPFIFPLAGALSRETSSHLAGVLTFGGLIDTFFEGAVNSFVALTGVLGPTGGVSKSTTATPQAGALGPAGELAKDTSISFIGYLISSVPPIIFFPDAGELFKTSLKPLAGALTTAGALARATATTLFGIFNVGGTLAKQTGKVLAGILATDGILAKQAGKVLAGILSFIGWLFPIKHNPPVVKIALADALITDVALSDSLVTDIELTDSALTLVTLFDDP